MIEGDEQAHVLITRACELVERYADLPFADEHVIAEACLVRGELCSWLAFSAEVGVVDDAEGAVAELDGLVSTLGQRPLREELRLSA